MNTHSKIHDKGLFIAFLFLLAWSPLPLGSNRATYWPILFVGFAILFILWLWNYSVGKAQLSPVLSKAKPIIYIFLFWIIYLWVQIIPLPWEVLTIISPSTEVLQAILQTSSGTISLAPHSTKVFLFHSVFYFVIFLLSLLLINSRGRLKQAALVLVLCGVFQATYGSLMVLSGLEYGFLEKKIHNLNLVTGTFVNRNHVAGYLEMCLAIGIGLLISNLGDGGSSQTWKQRIRNFAQLLLSPKIRLRLYLALMVIGLVMTHSRMGNTAFFSSLLIAGVIGLISSKYATRSMTILFTSLIIIDMFIVGAWFGVEKVVNRIQETSVQTEARGDVDIDSLKLLQDFPLLGSGGGTYEWVFPIYKGPDVRSHYDHAHNDYLEIATDTGLIGLGILGATVLWTFLVALKAQYTRRDPLKRGMAFASIMGIIAIMIHSSVDFNLQIPANAVLFMVILALGWISYGLPSMNESRSKRSRRRTDLQIQDIDTSTAHNPTAPQKL